MDQIVKSNPDIKKISREQVESDLTFLGLLVLKNDLKDATKEHVTKLNQAEIRVIMATGDNLQTAISVARDC
jgi:P-type E1-E2 ATPase